MSALKGLPAITRLFYDKDEPGFSRPPMTGLDGTLDKEAVEGDLLTGAFLSVTTSGWDNLEFLSEYWQLTEQRIPVADPGTSADIVSNYSVTRTIKGTTYGIVTQGPDLGLAPRGI